jgi:lipid II:glycine glycyltransferase (peptidoglycan interpeptide bridge formation enzyme)
MKDESQMMNYGFKLSKSPYLPTKTLQIDLTQSKETIYASFTKDCKYNIRKGEKVKTKECSTPNEIKEWHKEWKKSVKFDRYVPTLESLLNLRKSFPDNHSLFLASHNISSSIIGGALFTISSHGISNYISYYWYGFTNSSGRSSLSQYSLLYQGILWAKRMGCKVFDFEGIYDPRFPNRSWLGFSHFKRSFGNTEVSYPGCYTKFRFPL